MAFLIAFPFLSVFYVSARADRGKLHPGLQVRRQAEAQLWDDPFCSGREPRVAKYVAAQTLC